MPRPERDTARWEAFAVEPALPAPAPVESAPVESAVELDPAEPVVSANAIGIDATADPTPNATANAPTRPTYREQLGDNASGAESARRASSITRT